MNFITTGSQEELMMHHPDRGKKYRTESVDAEAATEAEPDTETAPDDTTPEEFPDISAGLAVLSKYQAMTGPREVLRKPNKRLEWSDFD